jgi:NitT/TauT family transport system substrate-binding protein
MPVKQLILIILAIVIGFGLAAFLKTERVKKEQASKKPNLTKVKIAMGYIPNVQFAPFYVALDKGYFTQEGLEINFDYNWETDIIALLAKNELQFGIGSGDQVILAREKGLPVVDFFNWYQRFPVCITSLAKNKISKPVDLIGKTVGTPAVYGASYIGWQAFLRQNKLPEQQIKLSVVGYTQVPSLTEGKVQAIIGYTMNEPVQLKSLGYQINNFEVAEVANFVSNGLLTNDQTIRDNPQLIRAFAKAFLRGLQDTLNNPEEAFLISKKYIPEMKDEGTQKQVLEESLRFWQADKLGLNNPDQWRESVDLLQQIGLLKEKPNPDSLFTNQFIP